MTRRLSSHERFLAKARPAKLGTIPTIVQLDGRSTLMVGRDVRVRKRENQPWMTVRVTRVDPDGYFMADL